MPSVFKLQIHKALDEAKLSYLSKELIQDVAVGADWVHGVMEAIREGTVDERLPAKPEPAVWLGYYRDHRRVTVAINNYFPEVLGGKGEEGQRNLDDLRAAMNQARENPTKFKNQLKRFGKKRLVLFLQEIFRARGKAYKRHLEEVRRELTGTGRKDKRNVDRILEKSPEFHWYLRVALPCVVVYRTFPITLLRMARRRGKGASGAAAQARAIERLVRLDPMAIHDPKIERWINGVHGSVRELRIQQVNAWVSEGLDTGKFSARMVKQSMGGLILALAELFGRYWSWVPPLLREPYIEARHVLELFHAVQRDKAGKVVGVYDEDLVDLQLESWRRAIKTQRKLWIKMLGPGGGFKSA